MSCSTTDVVKASAVILLAWDLYALYILVGSRVSVVGFNEYNMILWIENMMFAPFLAGAIASSFTRSFINKIWKSKKSQVVFHWLRCPKCGWSRLSTSRAALKNRTEQDGDSG